MKELVVAICGPLVNVAIVGILWLVVPGPVTMDLDLSRPGHFLHAVMVVNIVMVLFNLVPAFPMDGGRILRALLTMAIGDYAKATRWAATLGRTIAMLVVMSMLLSHWFNPSLFLVAFFVFFAAGQEATMVTEEQQVHDLSVRDAMMTDFQVLPPHAALRDAASLLLAGYQHDFPVLNEGGGLLGMITRHRLISALVEQGPDYPVENMLEPCDGYLEPQIDLQNAMEHLRASSCSALPVMDPYTGKVVGMLSTENIGETLLIRAALKKRLR